MSRVSLELVADSKQLLASLQAAQAQVEKFMGAAKDAGAELGGGVNRALDVFQGLVKGGAAAAGIYGGALLAVSVAATALGVSAAHNAEELVQLSAKLGIGTDKLQEYDVLLHRVGLSGDDLVVVFRKLSLKLEEARAGTGTAADRFRQLGIDIRTITGTDDLLRKIAEASSTLAAGMEKDAVMGDLMGRSALRLIPAFDGGTAAMDGAARKSQELGAILSGSQVETLVEVNHSLSDMEIAWKRFTEQMGAVVAPAIRLVTDVLAKMLATGADAFKSIDTAMDTLAIKATHLVLMMQEVGRVLFSKDALSGEAWKQVGANIAFIDDQVTKLVLKRQALAEMANPKDTRASTPALIDTHKASAEAMLAVDAQIKAMETAAKAQEALGAATFETFKSQLASFKALHLNTDLEIASSSNNAQASMSKFTKATLNEEMLDYIALSNAKMKLFTSDAKGIAEKAKFQIESNSKIDSLLNQITVAEQKAAAAGIAGTTAVAVAKRAQELQVLDDQIVKLKALDAAQQVNYKQETLSLGASSAMRSARIALIDAEGAREKLVIQQTVADEQRKASLLQSLDIQQDARRRAVTQEFPGIFQRQMMDIVNSATFSTAQIVNTWSSGIATMILKGGNLKSTLEATEMAILQGFLQLGAKMVAEWAAKQAAMLATNETAQSAITALFGVHETARSTITIAGSKAAAAAASAALVGVVAVGTATLGVLTVVLEAIVGFMLAVAAAVAEVPYIGQALAGLLIVGATLAQISGAAALAAAAAGLAAASVAAVGTAGFAQGGIGDFGAGTPAMLHGTEAVIPLDSRGARFIREAFGGGSDRPIHTHVHLDGRQIALALNDHTPGAWRTMGLI